MELNWFIKELDKLDGIHSSFSSLNRVHEMVIAHGTGTKSGNKLYSQWRMDILEYIEEKGKEDTVFNRLKKKKNKKDNTIFSKMKFMKGTK